MLDIAFDDGRKFKVNAKTGLVSFLRFVLHRFKKHLTISAAIDYFIPTKDPFTGISIKLKAYTCLDCAIKERMTPPVKQFPNQTKVSQGAQLTGIPIPHKAQCLSCKKMEPINRFGYCYRCYCIDNIIRWAKFNNINWIPGDPHPDWCQCGLPDHGDIKKSILN